MLKFLKIFLFIIVSLITNTSVYAETKIAYIDLDFILSNSNPGKKLFEDLKIRENFKINELKEKEKELKNEENKI